MRRQFLTTLLFVALNLPALPIFAQNVRTEIGIHNQASYRIDIPDSWNHQLIVYYHGFSDHPVIYKAGPPNKADRLFLENHYAVIQSGYSVIGWALAKAFPETEALRKYFVSKYGAPTRTYVAGESMGGTLTMMTIELSPRKYSGALALCGRLDSSNEARQYEFAMRAAFDYYFPGLLPPIDPVPQNYARTPELRKTVDQALEENPAGALAMRQLMRLHSNGDLAFQMLFITYVIKDAQEKAAGNPFDNRNYIYNGSPDDRALNDGVKRYAADPAATQFLVRYYTPSGRLLRPMLALNTTYDPTTNPSSIYPYELAVEAQEKSENFVQQYVHADGHCNFTPEQIWTAFDELTRWSDTAKRPIPGRLPQ